jgi:large subunit ribosomal protein L4
LNLLAEAKELQFAEKTGRSFADYLSDPDTEQYPRIQALNYQINVKDDLSGKALGLSRQQAEEIMIEIRQLEVQKAELVHEAAILAAQIHEQRSEALRLAGDEENADEQLELASGERTNVDDAEVAILEAKLEAAKQKNVAATVKRHFAGQQKTREEIRLCEEALVLKRAEIEAETAEFESVEDEAQVVDETTGVETRADPTKEDKRI